MTGAYFIRHRGRVRGPFTLDDLRHLREQGRLPQDVEISENGEEPFYPMATLAYLFEAVPEPPPETAERRPRVQPVRGKPRSVAERREPHRGDSPVVEPLAAEKTGPVPASRRGSGGGGGQGAALVLAIGSVLLLGAALLQDIWGTLAGSIKVSKGGRIEVRRTLGTDSVRSVFDAGKAELLPSEQKAIKHLSELPAGYGSASGFDASTRRLFISGITPEQIESTRRLALAIMLCFGLGAALAGGGAAIGLSQGATPRLLAMGSLLLALAGLACVVAFRNVGILGALATRGDGRFETGISFYLAAGGGVLLLLSGLMLSAAPSRRRRSFARRSVFND